MTLIEVELGIIAVFLIIIGLDVSTISENTGVKKRRICYRKGIKNE